MEFLTFALLILSLAATEAQVIPTQHVIPGGIGSVNGSSADGQCADSQGPTQFDSNSIICVGSSVIFDGVIPTLTGLDGDTWASQLLTIRSNNTDLHSNFFNPPEGFDGLSRAELVLFNCPQWGISVQNITVLAGDGIMAGFANLTVTSCDSLVRLCMNINVDRFDAEGIDLGFVTPDGSEWIHIAELEFYEFGVCSSDQFVITSPTEEPTTTTEGEAEETTTTEAEEMTTTMTTTSEETTDTTTTDSTECDTCFASVVITVVITGIFTMLLVCCCCLLLICFCVCCRRSSREKRKQRGASMQLK